jgi:excisionase family DNA binding protein
MMHGLLALTQAAEYVCLSVRTLRRYLGDATHPLPVQVVGEQWLFAREDLDRWMASFPQAGGTRDRLVDDRVHRGKEGAPRGKSPPVRRS